CAMKGGVGTLVGSGDVPAPVSGPSMSGPPERASLRAAVGGLGGAVRAVHTGGAADGGGGLGAVSVRDPVRGGRGEGHGAVVAGDDVVGGADCGHVAVLGVFVVGVVGLDDRAEVDGLDDVGDVAFEVGVGAACVVVPAAVGGGDGHVRASFGSCPGLF